MVNNLSWVMQKEVNLLKAKEPDGSWNSHFNGEGEHSEAHDLNFLSGKLSAPDL